MTAVLADIPVTIKNFKLGQFPLLSGSPDKINKPNHRGDIEDIID
jgi:hypothetical protein